PAGPGRRPWRWRPAAPPHPPGPGEPPAWVRRHWPLTHGAPSALPALRPPPGRPRGTPVPDGPAAGPGGAGPWRPAAAPPRPHRRSSSTRPLGGTGFLRPRPLRRLAQPVVAPGTPVPARRAGATPPWPRRGTPERPPL